MLIDDGLLTKETKNVFLYSKPLCSQILIIYPNTCMTTFKAYPVNNPFTKTAAVLRLDICKQNNSRAKALRKENNQGIKILIYISGEGLQCLRVRGERGDGREPAEGQGLHRHLYICQQED